MNVDVAVITAAIPVRVNERYLGRTLRSARDQYLQPREHLIAVDYEGVGPAKVRNALVASASSTWLAFCDDDDYLLPHHFSVLWHATEQADVIHSAFRVEGRDGWGWESLHEQGCSTLEPLNTIPMTTLVRRAAFLDVGGFGDARPEDLNLWVNLQAAGARFACVHDVTWVYRFHGHNASIEREQDGKLWW